MTTATDGPIVLIACGSNEFNRIKLENCLSRMGAAYLWLNTEFRCTNHRASYAWGSSPANLELVNTRGERFDARRVRGVWNRGLSYAGAEAVKPGTDDNVYLAEVAHSLAYLWHRLRNCNWVNPLSASRSVNRLVQLDVASALGLKVPATLVSSNGRELMEFVSAHGACITKRISQGGTSEAGERMILTNRLPQGVKFDDCVGAPVMLQELVTKKSELRVIVVGQRVLAGEIDLLGCDEDMVDGRLWVNTQRTYARALLDDDVCQRLIDLNRELGLRYSAIDLIRGTDGQLTFLEANPGGQWTFLEAHTGLPITEAICSELLAS